jgi:hypothetical protein
MRVVGAGWAAAALMGGALAGGCPKQGGDTSKEDPNVKAVRTLMGYIDSQIRVFAVQNRRAPRPDEGLSILFEGETPKDPWGNPIQYIVPGPDESAFDLLSWGADGQPGGKREEADLLWSALKR